MEKNEMTKQWAYIMICEALDKYSSSVFGCLQLHQTREYDKAKW
jgi:hypothetical protein